MTQPSLFDTPRPAEPRLCGTCVMWNGLRTDERGYCNVAREWRNAGAPACSAWFGLDQLRARRYGGGS